MKMYKKRIGCLVLAGAVTASLCSMSALAANYSDTAGHWAESSIARWTDTGIVNGTGNGNFNPNGTMTRAEAAEMFANLMQIAESADISNFTDVAANAWYADAIAKCVAAGIMNGSSDTTMEPNANLNREQMFVMLARALGVEADTSTTKNFDDLNTVSTWARGYVNALLNAGYISGVSNDSLAPLADINRASVMKLLDNVIGTYVTENGEVEPTADGIVLVVADDVTITGDYDGMIVVAKEGAKVSLKGATGDLEVVAVVDNVSVTNAPNGTVVRAADGVTGLTANGKTVSAGDEITIGRTTSSGGSSSGGGSSRPDPDNPDNPNPDEPVELPDGSLEWPDGTIERPDGTIEKPDGTIEWPDGTIETPDGTIEKPDGTIEKPDGTIEWPDGTVEKPDGTIEWPDGTIEKPDGTIEKPDGTIEKPDGTIEFPNGVIETPDGSIEFPDGSFEMEDGNWELPDGSIVDGNGNVVEEAQ